MGASYGAKTSIFVYQTTRPNILENRVIGNLFTLCVNRLFSGQNSFTLKPFGVTVAVGCFLNGSSRPEFEPTISASQRPKTHALDRASSGIGINNITVILIVLTRNIRRLIVQMSTLCGEDIRPLTGNERYIQFHSCKLTSTLQLFPAEPLLTAVFFFEADDASFTCRQVSALQIASCT